jgi:hypothetical protein
MKTRLALTALAVVIVGSFAMSAIPADSYRGGPTKPGPCFIDENKDGVCDHAPRGVTGGKGQKDDKATTGWNCPRGAGKGRGWGMKEGKMYPNLPDGGNSPSGGVTK